MNAFLIARLLNRIVREIFKGYMHVLKKTDLLKLKIGLNTGFIALWNLQIILTPLQPIYILRENQVKSWLLFNLFNFFSDFQPFIMVLIFFVLLS